MPFTFKVGTKIKEAWGLYKENFGFMLLLVLIMIVLQVLNQSFSKGGHVNILMTIVFAVVSIMISYVWFKSVLNLLNGKGFNPFSKESLPNLNQFWDFIKTNIVIFIFILPLIEIFVGIILAIFFTHFLIDSALLPIVIVPVLILFFICIFYIAARLLPAKYLSVDKCQGAIKSFSEAWSMTEGNGWRIAWSMLLIGLFIIAGFAAFFVGIVITYPVGIIVLVMLYRDLLKLKSKSEVSVGGEASKVEVIEEIIIIKE